MLFSDTYILVIKFKSIKDISITYIQLSNIYYLSYEFS